MGYGIRVLLVSLAALLAVAAFNAVSDPFGISHAGFDSSPLERDAFEENVRLAKAHIVSRLKPEAIIFGTSRVEVGLSPSHPAWRYERVYNLGLPHASLHESKEYFEHAVAVGALQQAVFGIDFFQFNPVLEPRPGFSEYRLRNPGSMWTRLRAAVSDVSALFMSRSATAASLGLLRGKPQQSPYLRDGSRNPRVKEASMEEAGSQSLAFLRSEREFFESPDLLLGFVIGRSGNDEPANADFEEILRIAHRNNIDLRVFISPTHALQEALLDAMQLNVDFFRWKRYLLLTMREIAAEFDASPYPLWDFSDATSFTTEPLPALDDAGTRMRWYWESSHYTRALGELVLDEVLAGVQTGLGQQLTVENFEDWTREVDRRHAEYRKTARDDISLMHAYLTSPEVRERVERESGLRTGNKGTR